MGISPMTAHTEEKHPYTHDAFNSGDFVVQRRASNGFGQLAVDQTIEQTINCDTKSKGGIIGFTVNKSAVQRWILTSHERAEVTQNCREMTGCSRIESEFGVKETGKARMARDEADVQSVVSLLTNWSNTFAAEDDAYLFHIDSGLTVPEPVTQGILGAYDKGRQASKAYIKERLINSTGSVYDTISRLNVPGFSTVTRKIKVAGDVIIKADRDLFSRLLVIAQSREMDLRELLKFSLGPLSFSISISLHAVTNAPRMTGTRGLRHIRNESDSHILKTTAFMRLLQDHSETSAIYYRFFT
ncbi:uncharacterized protein LOC125568273 [Nematostella vectensis]|uniref:uncharacterized protein LOC125568273 n=1 Tax=Nematostella vectensis TaxID=45351 RepID=UPI0020777245|nr:uncharacterized protein LOC125568273 [Nematostella vectensis]